MTVVDKLRQVLSETRQGHSTDIPNTLHANRERVTLLEADQWWGYLGFDPGVTVSDVREVHRLALRNGIAREKRRPGNSWMTDITLERTIALGLDPLTGENLPQDADINEVLRQATKHYFPFG